MQYKINRNYELLKKLSKKEYGYFIQTIITSALGAHPYKLGGIPGALDFKITIKTKAYL